MKIIRIFVRNVRDAFRSVVRNFSLSLAAITCITITLILVALSMVITANVNNFTKTLEEELSIVVYLNEDVSAEMENEIYSNISGLEGVEKATLKTKEEWKKEIQSYSSELDATLSYLEDNPLLDSVIVKVKDMNLKNKNFSDESYICYDDNYKCNYINVTSQKNDYTATGCYDDVKISYIKS